MPEMHIRRPGFTSSPCEPFTKNKERIKLIFNMAWLID